MIQRLYHEKHSEEMDYRKSCQSLRFVFMHSKKAIVKN